MKKIRLICIVLNIYSLSIWVLNICILAAYILVICILAAYILIVCCFLIGRILCTVLSNEFL